MVLNYEAHIKKLKAEKDAEKEEEFKEYVF